MREILPRGLFRKVCCFGTLLIGFSCQHVTRDPAVTPGPPIAAEPEIDLEPMDTECAGLLAAIDRYGQCPNLEDNHRQWVRSVMKATEQSFAAGKKAEPDEPSQKAIAMACR